MPHIDAVSTCGTALIRSGSCTCLFTKSSQRVTRMQWQIEDGIDLALRRLFSQVIQRSVGQDCKVLTGFFRAHLSASTPAWVKITDPLPERRISNLSEHLCVKLARKNDIRWYVLRDFSPPPRTDFGCLSSLSVTNFRHTCPRQPFQSTETQHAGHQ